MKVDIYNTDKKYDIIYADPPWAYLWWKGKNGGNFCPEKHYQTMSTEEICELGKYIKTIREKTVHYSYGQQCHACPKFLR